jgi:hypothetical protein
MSFHSQFMNETPSKSISSSNQKVTPILLTTCPFLIFSFSKRIPSINKKDIQIRNAKLNFRRAFLAITTMIIWFWEQYKQNQMLLMVMVKKALLFVWCYWCNARKYATDGRRELIAFQNIPCYYCLVVILVVKLTPSSNSNIKQILEDYSA